MNLLKLEKLARQVQVDLFKSSESRYIGDFKAKFKGQGLQFKEHQVYSHGDDIRFIDWKILAKTGKPHIKNFEEERNTQIIIMLDASESMLMGYNSISKLQAAVEICFLFYLLAQKSKDIIRIILYADEIVPIPKGVGRGGILKLLKALMARKIVDDQGDVLLSYRPKIERDLNKQCHHLMSFAKQRTELVLLSDFYHFIPNNKLEKILAHPRYHCFQILSPIDRLKKWPYSLFGYTAGHKGEKNFSISRNKLNNFKIPMTQHKKLKKIDVDKDYLRQFIMELRND